MAFAIKVIWQEDGYGDIEHNISWNWSTPPLTAAQLADRVGVAGHAETNGDMAIYWSEVPGIGEIAICTTRQAIHDNGRGGLAESQTLPRVVVDEAEASLGGVNLTRT